MFSSSSSAPSRGERCKTCFDDTCPELKSLGLASCAANVVKDKVVKDKRDVVVATCPFGQVRSKETSNNCCWPGQAFKDGRCVGRPAACPEQHFIEGEQCIQERCAEGKARVDGVHCCWLQQTWSAQTESCEGAAACVAGFVPEGSSCIPVEEVEARALARRAAEDAERAKVEEQRLAAEQAHTRAELESARDAAATQRVVGGVISSVGLFGLGLTGVMLGLGAQQNVVIQTGEPAFANVDDLEAAAELGAAYNVAAVVSGVVGGIVVAAGATWFFLHPGPADPGAA